MSAFLLSEFSLGLSSFSFLFNSTHIVAMDVNFIMSLIIIIGLSTVWNEILNGTLIKANKFSINI